LEGTAFYVATSHHLERGQGKLQTWHVMFANVTFEDVTVVVIPILKCEKLTFAELMLFKIT